MLPVIFGISGHSLTDAERDVFRARPPLGFILFRRNIDNPDQVKKLTASLRELTGRSDTPILIDQEGGRVQRLRPPHWVDLPQAHALGDLYKTNAQAGRDATVLHTRTIAGMLSELGINVVCAPVLDVPVAGAHDVIGNRAFGTDVATVTELGALMARTFLDCGVTPIIKHIPGHGRAGVDSHHACPTVSENRDTLNNTDFAPFKDVAAKIGPRNAWAMTAHIIFTAMGADPVSVSSAAIDALRAQLGIDGVIIPDAIEMDALGGTVATRAVATLRAGCDATMHCSGKFDDIKSIVDVLPDMTDIARARLADAEKARQKGASNVAAWRDDYKKLRALIPDEAAYQYTTHQALNVA